MREVDPGSDAKSGVTASGGALPSEPPPSSTRGFIGTNTDAAQAYVPPTTLPETPEPPVPNTKVALSDGVDPRKLPTMPNLKKVAAQVFAAELDAEKPAPKTTSKAASKPAPVIEAPPDSQISSIRRGAGYAPPRRVAGPSVPPSSRNSDPIPRATPAKGLKVSVRPPPMPEPAETPAQRRAALLLIFLFAALLAVAVYFFLRRAPSPPTEGPAPSGSALTPISTTRISTAPASTTAAPAPSQAPSATLEPSAPVSAATAQPPPGGTGGRSMPSSEPSQTPVSTPPAPSTTTAPASPATAAPAPSGPDGPKSDRWF